MSFVLYWRNLFLVDMAFIKDKRDCYGNELEGNELENETGCMYRWNLETNKTII